MEIANEDTSALIELTTELVAAYVANNRVSVGELPDVIASVYDSLKSVGQASVAPVEKPIALVPAVPVKKSITPDYLICLEDGKRFKSMKRHLATLGMTPDDYRRKWGLPKDYPMVAADYASKRSELALRLGLGRKKNVGPVAEPVAPAKPARAKKAKVSDADAT